MKKYDKEFQQYKKCRICDKPKLRAEMVGSRCPDCIPTEKSCTKCHIVKPLSDFTKRNTTPDGRTSECKKCLNRRLKVKKNEKKDSIIVRNPYLKGSLDFDVYQFMAQHLIRLTKEETKIICSELQESQNKLSTLDAILKRYKVGIDNYVEEFKFKTKAVLQFELDDKNYENPIGRFESATEACLNVKGNIDARGNVSKACRTGMKAIGYRWRFEESEE